MTGLSEDTMAGLKKIAETLSPPTAPMDVARELVSARYTGPDGMLTLRHWRGGWWRWTGPHWTEVEPRTMSSAAYRFTEKAEYLEGDKPKPWAPTRRKIGDLLDAVAAVVHLPQSVSMPAWLDGTAYDGLIVATANGLLNVGTRELLSHDPTFFNATSVPFDYDPGAPPPVRWGRFLRELWGEDTASISVLAEWFGYVISGRLDLHKILLLVGPTRAGKGVVARTLGHLVGRENVAGPTLHSLNGEFGLQPLLGKSLAVVSDARMNGRAHVVVERLLSISGEDTLTVNIKMREQWSGKLPCRLMLCSNELPQLGDASMAVAGRFVPLLLTQTWYGREDLALEDELREELPGILNFALTGLEQLTGNGKFTRSPGADDAIQTLQDLASPVAAFVRDCCVKGPDERVPKDELYATWRAWTEDSGHTKTSQSTFGRDLRAALGGRLKDVRPRDGGARHREYVGIDLTADARADMAKREADRATR